MRRYWVVGGEYTDTSFTRLSGDKEPARVGPFDTYDEAKAVWRAKSMETVDLPLFKYRIEEEDATTYWVVGGVYRSTNFKETADGRAEERLGPFHHYDKALEVWRERAMATVDDAHARFRIERV